MNPARSLAPGLLSGNVGDLWLYWSATFVGTSVIAIALHKKFNRKNETHTTILAVSKSNFDFNPYDSRNPTIGLYRWDMPCISIRIEMSLLLYSTL